MCGGNGVQERCTLSPDSSMVAVVRTPQRTKYFIDVMFAMKSTKLLYAYMICVYRVGKRDPIVPLTYRPTA
mgnify:CR=1 FL=1